MCSFTCDRLIQKVEDGIEKHKQDFRRSPQFIVITREYYECFVWRQAVTEPGSNVFVNQFQGIKLVLIPGREILALAGSPIDMFFHQLKVDSQKPN